MNSFNPENLVAYDRRDYSNGGSFQRMYMLRDGADFPDLKELLLHPTVYMLKKTALEGNSMATEHEVTVYEKPFSSVDKAILFAESETGNRLTWKNEEGKIWAAVRTGLFQIRKETL